MTTATLEALLPGELVTRAAEYLRTVLRPTPCQYSPGLSDLLGRQVWLKWELIQPTRSFKVRGALFAVHELAHAADPAAPLVTASTGNHGLGVAFAAFRAGRTAHVYVPEGANPAKVGAMRVLGAQIHVAGSDWQEAFEHASSACVRTGLSYVHSFDDPHIVAGQSTIGTELADDGPEGATVLAPVGGGGLIAGVARGLAVAGSDAKIVGVEPAGADRMRRSLEAGRVVRVPPFSTIADGLAARAASDLTFGLARELVDRVVTVGETAIREAMAEIFRAERLVVEPSSATTIAALATYDRSVLPGDRVVCLMTGGNVDPALLREVVGR
ncbi:threonine ammonia-lyase [Amycolatopsis ultiminotia]|uniref:Threonine ammonia-lyase n=1 Tax=Amycolatopsis ultiminotia TaxID=543629 RepID=A0ABP6YHD4_9PSEU